jgi:aspartate/methionine/tyrosine aminotransferase
MPSTAIRLGTISESVIREMTRVADQYGAINLSQGYPDFEPPSELLKAANEAVRAGYNQYAVTWGAPRFRQALALKQSHFMGLEIDPDRHLTVTCGSTEAMLASLMAICNPGDKVIVFAPFYENYIPGALLAGAEVVYVNLYPPEFTFDPDDLRLAFRQGAKALVLCNPSNPTGKVYTFAELDLLMEMAQEYDAFIVTDEVYEHIIYEPHRHTYIASLPGAFERVISCSSLSKTYAITGWRLGYAIAAAEISAEIRKVHDFLTVGAPAPLQEAAVTALNFPSSYYQQLQEDYAHRKATFEKYLIEAGLQFTRPQGAYYVLVDIQPFLSGSGSGSGIRNDTEFCSWLAKEVGVAAVPGSSFSCEPESHWVRLNFAKKEETLIAAGERLLKIKELF